MASHIGIKVAVLIGGVSTVNQAVILSNNPNVLVGTPGRLLDHLNSTKGFSLSNIRYLVLDEADRLLDLQFEKEILSILSKCPPNSQRTTFLFSATMTDKVEKLQKASLKNPVNIKTNTKYSTVTGLSQNYVFLPWKYKYVYLAYLLSKMSGLLIIVFCSRVDTVQKVALTLRNLGIGAISLHGQMSQVRRVAALNKIRQQSDDHRILITTDVSARGIDIPFVDIVINFDLPTNAKTYIHRVGRTARAGRNGQSIDFVTQYDIEVFQRIEHSLGKKLTEYQIDSTAAMAWLDKVNSAFNSASKTLRESGELRITQDEDLANVLARKKRPYHKKRSKR